jgi:hypothetical protein
MDLWNVLEVSAWLVAGALLLWMGVDAIRVGNQFSEDVLTSSEEGHDDLLQDGQRG